MVLGFLLMRRRRAPAIEDEAETDRFEAPVGTVEEPLPAPPTLTPVLMPVLAPVLAPATIPAPSFAPALPAEPARASGQMDFEPIAMRVSLVYATLQFRLVLTARTAFPAGRLLGDMISAHGSLSRDEQLAPPPQALAIIQAIPRLAPGQVLDVKGELRLPLAAIRPLRQGAATFMVPLVRLALLGDGQPGLPRLELGCVFTIGIPGAGPALAPLRLDTGPRDFPGLSAREIEAARRTVLLPLDPARAAG
ncbi:hypothetical protein SAMN05518801_104157 [Novosphingobium sp. CF614]|nr:hypothetical protein SAMN05518801_104157 [Novosphingobium sp. CF614]